MSTAPFLELNGVTKKFGDFTALDAVDLQITEGEFFTLVGPSGSGKTTMIRLLVGMDQPTSGELRLQGNAVDGALRLVLFGCLLFQHTQPLQSFRNPSRAFHLGVGEELLACPGDVSLRLAIRNAIVIRTKKHNLRA